MCAKCISDLNVTSHVPANSRTCNPTAKGPKGNPTCLCLRAWTCDQMKAKGEGSAPGGPSLFANLFGSYCHILDFKKTSSKWMGSRVIPKNIKQNYGLAFLDLFANPKVILTPCRALPLGSGSNLHLWQQLE